MKIKLKSYLTRSVSSFFVRRISSFTYLNVTQFLGALNDNIFKLLIVYFFIEMDGIENSHKILALTGATFVLPFLLFSASSGMLADRFSKRNIIVITKVFELFIMVAGVTSFAIDSRIGGYLTLFLLATHSAIFGPSKYGIIPELVESEDITKANGMMTSFTFLAVILGTFTASFLVEITGRNYFIASSFCFLLSLVGLATSLCIEYTPPSGSNKRFNVLFLSEIYRSLKRASQHPSLLMAVVGSAYFLFIGSFMQLNMIPYAVHTLGLTDVQGGYLFLMTALGIGSGSILAGKISGKTVELGLVPVALLGTVFSCFYLGFYSYDLSKVLPMVVIAGVFGGMYQVPLDSYIQVASPTQERGQIIAGTNFLSFIGVLLSSLFIYLMTEVFGLGPDQGFTIIGVISLFVVGIIGYQYFDYFTRFSAMVISKIHFHTVLFGTENVPSQQAVYVCTHVAWNDTLLMMGAQRRRMRFFIENEQDHSIWLKRLYKILRVVQIPSIEPLEKNARCLQEIRKTLDKGISVCIFVDNPDTYSEILKLMDSYSFREMLKGTDYPIIPVAIVKGTKDKKPRFFKRMMEKIRVPAFVSFGGVVT